MKKIIALLLVLALAVSCFVGCDDTKPVDTKPVDTKPATGDTKGTEPAPTEVENRFDGKHEIVELVWCVRQTPQEDEQKVLDYLNKTYLEPRYNLRLKTLVYANAEYNDKMTLNMTGGEKWDICYTANFVNVYADRVAMGAYYNLNDLMDSPVWAELMEVYPEGLYDWAIIDGELYGLPNYQIMSSPQALFVQKELADKYKLPYKDGDTIKDLSDPEMYKFLEAVRDNEQGKYWPNQYASFNTYSASIFKEFQFDYQIIAGGAVSLKTNRDYEVKNWWDIPEYYNAELKYYTDMLGLFQDGIFREDFLTVQDDTTDYNANRYACYISTGKPGGGADASNRMGKEYIQIYMNDGKYYEGSPMTTCTAINYACKDPEAALKMITVMWTDKDVYNTFLFGIPGEHYNKVSENRAEPIADSGYSRSGWGWGCGNQFNQWLVPGQDDDVWDQTIEMNQNGLKSSLTGFEFIKTDVEAEVAAISTVSAEYGSQYQTCKDEAEVKAWLDKYIDEMKKAGADTVRDEVEKQLHAWAKANGYMK